MIFEFAKPSNALQPYIKQYWAIENVLGKDEEHVQRIIATGLPELSFHFGDRPKSTHRTLEGNLLINGQQNDYYDLLIADRLSMFTVTFQPSGLSHFLTIPMDKLQNQTIKADFIDEISLSHLEGKLTEAVSFNNRVEIVERFFIKLLSNKSISIDHKRMMQAVQLIKQSKGNISIELLASNACLSRKQFERKFSAHIGLSPKQFLKIIRFQQALYLNEHSLTKNLTELAHTAGYYDQSHFINDFKELSGLTPKKLFESKNIISDFFS